MYPPTSGMMAAGGWQPQEAGLVQLCQLFTISQRGENQAEILQQLETYKAHPDFNNYLAYIFAAAEQVPLEVRQSAGLYLKNSLRQHYTQTDAALKDYIKAALVPMLAHPQRALRHTVGSNISTMVSSAGLADWPGLVGVLQQCLASPDPAPLDGGLDTLFKIVEESPIQMEASVVVLADASAGAPPAPQQTVASSLLLVPPLLKLLQTASSADVRRQAVACLNLMTRDMPPGIAQNLDAYLHSLFALAHDSHASVRQEVVKGMVQLLTVQPDRLQPFIYQVVEYMLQCNEADDEGIALESCEFWRSFCDAKLDSELLRPFLPRLIPMLMKNMVFDEHDEEVQDALAAEVARGTPDKTSELQPLHHKQGAKHGDAPREEDDGDDDDEALSRWNLRRCSAAGLDRLAVVYGDDLLPVLMPIVEQRLQEQDWRARESAILALGAVSEGCHMGLLPYLSGMTDMLVPKVQDPQPMVRIISCWALMRYAYWLLAGAQEAAAAPQGAGAPAGGDMRMRMAKVVQALLGAMMDHNKFVQDSACSAMATICQVAAQEDAAHMLVHLLPDMVRVISTAVKQYGRRNIHLACDALCMLGEAAGPSMREPALVPVYMASVCERLAALGPHERELVPLFECVLMACGVLGPAVAQWAPATFQAALGVAMAQAALRAAGPGTAAAQAPGWGTRSALKEYDPGLHALALDVVDGLSEALGPSVEPLVANTPLMQLVMSACQDHGAPDVRQAAFGLVGDLSKVAISLLVPHVPQLAQAALLVLVPQAVAKKDMVRACNNACWSLGELAVRLAPEHVAAWATVAAERTAALLVLGTRQLPPSLVENAAITLGRVAWRTPDALAPHFGHFCAAWCEALRNVRDEVEKEQAFHGLCALLQRNAEPVLAPGPAFAALAVAVTSWRTMHSVALQQELRQTMQAIQGRMTAAGTWQLALSVLDPAMAQCLATLCSGGAPP